MKNGDKAGGKAGRTLRRKTVCRSAERRSDLPAGVRSVRARRQMPRSSDASETRHWNSRGQHPRYCTQFLTPHRDQSVLGGFRGERCKIAHVTHAEIVMPSRETYPQRSAAKYGPSPNWPGGNQPRPEAAIGSPGEPSFTDCCPRAGSAGTQHEFPQGAAFARQFGIERHLAFPAARHQSR